MFRVGHDEVQQSIWDYHSGEITELDLGSIVQKQFQSAIIT